MNDYFYHQTANKVVTAPISTGNVALSIQELQAQVRKLELDNSYMQLDIERLQESVRELERINSRY